MENKKRLIDANTLKGDFLFLRKMWSSTEISKVIDEAPAVDAVELEHGRWEAAGFDGHGDYKECCSNCKSWSVGDDKLYCPVCGAKMDG